MGKDPAFLFYPGDWLGGTMGMSFEQKGAYFELLIFQFNNGKFTETQAKQVLSICNASVWHNVKQKFTQSGDYFYNQRLQKEIEQRINFSNSRRANAKSKKITPKTDKAYAQHMEDEDENGIELNIKRAFDEIYIGNIRGGWNNIDFDFELKSFQEKVRGSPGRYQGHDVDGLRLALQSQLRKAKPKSNGTGNDKKQQHTNALAQGVLRRYGVDAEGKKI